MSAVPDPPLPPGDGPLREDAASPRLPRFLWALAAAAVLFGLFSVARESLVPHGADFERARWRLTGDEPAYLLTAQALANGDGEDVSRVHAARTYTNYQSRIVIGGRQWTYDDYVNRCRVRFLLDRRKAWGDAQILHGGPLEPLFAAPFALSPNRPRWKILFAQGAFAALIAALLVWFAPGGARAAPFAAATCVAFLGGAPVVWYTAQIFPEILLGSLLALSLLLSRRRETAFRLIGHLCLFLSLWGSSRVVAAVAAVVAVHAAAAIRRRRWIDLAVLAAGVAAYFGYHLWRWGNFFPPNTDPNSPISLALIPRGFLRYYFGNSVGLLMLAPVAWTGLLCLGLLLRRPGRDPAILPCAALAFGISLSVAAFPAFRGGTCPAGRYQVAEAFVLVVPVLLFLHLEPAGSPWRRRVLFLLASLGAATLALGAWLATNPAWWFERYHPAFRHPRLQPHYGWLPDFDGRWLAPLALWLALFLGATFAADLFLVLKRRK